MMYVLQKICQSAVTFRHGPVRSKYQ